MSVLFKKGQVKKMEPRHDPSAHPAQIPDMELIYHDPNGWQIDHATSFAVYTGPVSIRTGGSFCGEFENRATLTFLADEESSQTSDFSR